MDSIIQKIFKKSYLENKHGIPVINIFQMRLDLKNEYNIIFVYDKLKDILLEGNFAIEYNSFDGYRYLIRSRRQMIESVNKEDILRSIDAFFLNIIKPHINHEYSYIKTHIANDYGINMTCEQIAYYVGMINSNKMFDKELIKSLISERRNITFEVIKKVSNILNLDEDKTAIFLEENGYEFKISDT